MYLMVKQAVKRKSATKAKTPAKNKLISGEAGRGIFLKGLLILRIAGQTLF